MAQSSEYPDLKWMPPKSYTEASRKSVQLVVIHDTEGSEAPTSAEDGASYDQRRTDQTSTHFFHDQNSTVQCVSTADIAHAARYEGNRRGIQHELCGKASQGAAGWADAASMGTLRQAAKQVARDCKKWGIPVRKLTAQQVADGVKGICGHADVTKAFPKDGGDHTDPGPTFPWSQFIGLVQAALTPAQEEDDMDQTTFNKLMDAWWNDRMASPATGKDPNPALVKLRVAPWQQVVGRTDRSTHTVLFTDMLGMLKQAAGAGDVDEAAIAQSVLTGLNPQEIAAAVVAALPADQAKQMADELAHRLAA
jgi:N-acetyl-anhydromuramyl-L-alanine amidase AmpD